MHLTRRHLLKLGAGAAVACAANGLPLEKFAQTGKKKEKKSKKIPIGLQLYSVRKMCEQDLPGVIKRVSEIGYQGVEFAGYYGRSAEQLRKMLDENGLVCCGTHLRASLTALDGGDFSEFDKEAEFNRVLGNPYLIFPWMPDQLRNSAEACKKTGELLTRLAERVKQYDGYVGYHAHGGDFGKIGDATQWDLLFENSGDRVVMQMDVGNCIGGGGDPYATLKKFPGRSLTVHLKEYGGPPAAALGEGDVDWKQVFQICETVGGTRWYIVEHEVGDKPLESVAACLKNLRKMGK